MSRRAFPGFLDVMINPDEAYYELPQYWALRNLAKKYLAAMERTLDILGGIVGHGSRHWKTLNTKRQVLQDYQDSTLTLGARQQAETKAHIMRDIKHKVKELSKRGTEPFYRYQRNFINSCFNLLNTEADRLATDIRNSHKQHNQRLKNLIRLAHTNLKQLQAFLAENDASSETFNFQGYWAKLMLVQGNLKDLAFAFTTVWKRNSLEVYLDYTIINPQQYEVRLRKPTVAFRRLVGLPRTEVIIDEPEIFVQPAMTVPRSPLKHSRIQELLGMRRESGVRRRRSHRPVRYTTSPLAAMEIRDISDISASDLSSEFAGVPSVIGIPL